MMIKFIKIWANGSYERYAWLDVDGKISCYRIKDELYQYLKACGVPTSQSLRYKK